MKKLSTSTLKKLNGLLAGMLTLLGFTACDNSVVSPDMYGTPHADFNIKGKVVNEKNEPVPDIEIKCLSGTLSDNQIQYDTIPAVTTDSEGVFTCRFSSFPANKLQIIATDVDEELNGSYEKYSTEVSLSEKDYKDPDRGHWFNGTVTKEINITLSPKTSHE